MIEQAKRKKDPKHETTPAIAALPHMRIVVVHEPTLRSRITVPQKELQLSDGVAILLAPGVNVLVGPNGSGKTSFIKSFQNHELQNTVLVKPEGRGARFFTPPKELLADMVAAYFIEGPLMDVQLANLYRSHGQGVHASLPRLIEEITEKTLAAKEGAGLLIALDEPEGYGLDVQNMSHLIGTIKAAAARGIQFAVASHHPYFLLDDSFNFVTFGSQADYAAKARNSCLKTICGMLKVDGAEK